MKFRVHHVDKLILALCAACWLFLIVAAWEPTLRDMLKVFFE